MNFTISRRDALAGLGSLAALNLPTPARAADPLPVVRVSIVPIYAVSPHFAALAQGYFEPEGIAVTTVTVQGGSIGIPGLMGGSFDVLYSNAITNMTALERGIDIRIFADGAPIPTQPPDPGAVIIRKGEPIRTGKDLEGKVIAINARFDIQWLVMQGWVKKTGGDLSKITYREVPLPSMLDALRAKQVDAALVLDPFMTIGLEDPAFERAAWALSTAMGGLPSSSWIVSGQTADTKPELVRAYARGFAKGVAWINANLGKKPFFDLVAGYTKTDPKLMEKMFVAGQPTSIDVNGYKRLIELMKEYDLLKTTVPVESKIFKV